MIFFEMQLVELKNGETYNGHLVNCDTWMNIHLREVICTSKVRMLFMTIACVRNLFIL
jgi:small nuclear ribonucleoprotein (snRNP)-like protein